VSLRLVLDTDNARAVTARGRVACFARAGARKLRSHGSRLVGLSGTRAAAVCSWKVPRGLRGKVLRALVRVVVDDVELEQTVARKLR
jgi:hypothetical protein